MNKKTEKNLLKIRPSNLWAIITPNWAPTIVSGTKIINTGI